MHFLKTLKCEKTIFGDFNIDTLNEHKDKRDYTNLLAAYDFQVQNFLPTRVTLTSKTCLDHMITEGTVNTETIQTTISDHFTVTAKVPAIWKQSKNTNVPLARNLNRLKGESALNFLFLQDQKLKKMNETSDVNAQMKEISESIMACVDHFAPEKPRTGQNKTDGWITNKIKYAIRKRDDLFQLWIRNPIELNCEIYRKCRNKVSEMIRSEKKNANSKKLGTNPTAKTIYITLKSIKKQHDGTNLPDLNV